MLTLLADVGHVRDVFHYQFLVVFYVEHVQRINLIELIVHIVSFAIRAVGLELQVPRFRHGDILRQTLLLPWQSGAQVSDNR